MVTTVSYMPPEQAMGGEVTPRSDLYSLGAMLYEMVTGRPPFLGDDSVAIIGQHINTPPVAPTWHNGQCPRALDALILRLLAKDPSERPGSATDVLSALDAIDLTDADVGAHGHAPLQDNDPHALDSLAGGVFVGRQQEMGDLKAALEDTLSGRGRLVTLVGEPGIGKSRTAQELATYAGLRQAQVLWGRCYEGEGAPPYWPWVQAIRSYVRDRDSEELRSEMGAGAADIAGIVSEVSEKLPALAAPPELEPEQARFRLFDSITAFLKSASRRQPLVLVLDDMHWADHPSLLLLEFVARELAGSRLLVIGTYRDMELSRRHPLSLTLGELSRERLFQRVLLRGLSQEDVGRFIELVAGITPPLGLVESVYQQTEGNPLFVTEVVRLLVQEGELTQEKAGQRDSWSVRIPEGVREVIGRRLDRLSERCNETLTIASVIGRGFTLEHLRPLIEDVSEDRLLEVLEEALAARVTEELPGSVGRYQFTHALIQETLAGELSTTRKVRLHARIAETLENLYGEDAEAHAAELAYHFNEAQTVLGTEKLVRYALLAGERALTAYAHEDALDHFQRVLSSGGNEEMDDDQAAALFGVGRAQMVTLERYQVHLAVARLGQAFDYYAENGNVAQAVAVAETAVPTAAGHPSGMEGVVVRALAFEDLHPLQEARLLSYYGWMMGLERADYNPELEALNRALVIAQQQGNLSLQIRSLVNSAEVNIYHGHMTEGLDKALSAVKLASEADDPRSETIGHFSAFIALVVIGDSETAALHADSGREAAERLGQPFFLAGRALYISEMIPRLRGQWEVARNFSDQGLALSPNETRLLGTRVILELEVGDAQRVRQYLDSLLEARELFVSGPTIDHAILATTMAVASRITGEAAWQIYAEDSAEIMLSSPNCSPVLAYMARAALGVLAIIRGDSTAAAEQYEALGNLAIGVIWDVEDRRVRGLLAQTMGNLDQAMVHFEDSLTFCREAGYRPDLAWTCCDYADMLKERNAEGDREKAVLMLDESLAISSELGMRPLMERVLSRREILKA